jgi:hypothetical protein
MGGRSLVSGGGEGGDGTGGVIDAEENTASSSEWVNTGSGLGGDATGVEGSSWDVTREEM